MPILPNSYLDGEKLCYGKCLRKKFVFVYIIWTQEPNRTESTRILNENFEMIDNSTWFVGI